MRPLLLSFAAAALIASTASTASADPPCVTPCVAEAPTPTKMRSIPVFATGIFFDVVGAAAFAGGVGVVLASHDCGTQISCSAAGTVVDLVGIAAMAGGAIFLAIGIPLTIVGGRTVPDVHAKNGLPVWTF